MIGTTLHSWTLPDIPGFGLYYLTAPPVQLLADPGKLTKNIAELYPKMADYFKVPSDSYRIFLRESPRGYGGSAYAWSFLIEWDEGVMLGNDENDVIGQQEDLYFLISHEMVHNWSSMQGRYGGQEDADTTWYEEGKLSNLVLLMAGIATFYQVVLPYATGLITADVFKRQLNNVLSAYYTSPAINLSSIECARDAWTNMHAQRLPYYRGALYLLHLDAMIRHRSGGYRTLQDPVNELVQLQHAGRSYGFREWTSILAKYINSHQALRTYKAMSAGAWVVSPPHNCLGTQFQPFRQDQRVYNTRYAIERRSNGDQVITRVDERSNAYHAGIRNGDIVTWSHYSFGGLDNYARNQTVTLASSWRRYRV